MKGLCLRMDSHFYEWSGTFSGFRGLENSMRNLKMESFAVRGQRYIPRKNWLKHPLLRPPVPSFPPPPPPRVDTAIENLDTINFLIYQRQNWRCRNHNLPSKKKKKFRSRLHTFYSVSITWYSSLSPEGAMHVNFSWTVKTQCVRRQTESTAPSVTQVAYNNSRYSFPYKKKFQELRSSMNGNEVYIFGLLVLELNRLYRDVWQNKIIWCH